MKKGNIFGFVFGLILTIFLLQFVLAQNDGIGVPSITESSETIGTFFSNLFQQIGDYLLNSSNSISDFLQNNNTLIIKFLYAALLITLIYSIIDMTDIIPEKNEWIKLVISIAIGGIAFIALPDGFIELLIPSYKSVFSTILSIIPFILILGISLKIPSLTLGRLMWLFVTVFFSLLFFSKGIPAFQNREYIQGLIYLVLAGIGIFMVIFLRSMRSWFFRGEAKELAKEMESMVDVDTAVQKAHKVEAQALKKMNN